VQRRLTGIGLLAAAIAAVLVVPGVLGRPEAGTPRIGPIPGAPVQGSCLSPITTNAELESLIDDVPVVPCSSPHGAEITLVANFDSIAFPNPGWPTSNHDPIFNEPIAVCDTQNARFTGVTGISPVDRVLPRYRSKVAIPNQVQWLAGQRWYACEVLPDTTLPLRYRGTAEGALFGVPPSQYATCARAPHSAAVPCDRPHSAEQLTMGYRGPIQAWPPLPPPNGDDCRELAGSIIGTSDPEFGGRIEIIGWFDGSGLSCWLQAADGRLLVGTLIGHGSGPLPFT
jgi:hypothetical protein